MTPNITEHKALKQANEIFNNSIMQLLLKLDEEKTELGTELLKQPIDKVKVLDELADVCYVMNQLMERFDTNYQDRLTYAINKIEQRKKEGKIIIKQLQTILNQQKNENNLPTF